MQVDRTRIYRVSAVAKMLDVSPNTIYRAIDAGALDALRIAGAVRVTGEALHGWLEQCAQAVAEVR